MNQAISNPVVAIVDDEESILDFLSGVLKEQNIESWVFKSGQKALESIKENPFDLVVTDLTMPGLNGLQLLDAIKEQKEDLPVILMSGCADTEAAVSAVNLNAFEMLLKPFTIQPFIEAVDRGIKWSRSLQDRKNIIVELKHDCQTSNQELLSSITKMDRMNREMLERLTVAAEYRDNDTGEHINRVSKYVYEMLERLTVAAEYRDNDTGEHINRVSKYVYCLARGLNFKESDARSLAQASSMHDIGKIGISDEILFKKAPLTAEEFITIQNHTVIGQKILDGSSFPILGRAASIALNHHERWDGSGYPNGLKGEQIPLDSRIVIVADIYDALRTERPYKKAFSHEDACNIIINGDGRTLPEHFAPDLIATFIRVAPRLDEISADFINHHADNELFESDIVRKIVANRQSHASLVERLKFMDS